MSVILNDSFTESVDTELSLHSPETGGAWVKHTNFVTSATVNAANDWLIGGSTSATSAYYNNGWSGADVDITAVVRLNAAGGTPGILARVQTGASTFYQLYIHATNALQLDKVINGSPTSLFTSSGLGIVTGVDYTIRLTVQGTILKVYFNGTLISGEISDSAITAAGYVGVRVRADGRVTSISADNGISVASGDTAISGTATVSGIASALAVATASIAAGAGTALLGVGNARATATIAGSAAVSCSPPVTTDAPTSFAIGGAAGGSAAGEGNVPTSFAIGGQSEALGSPSVKIMADGSSSGASSVNGVGAKLAAASTSISAATATAFIGQGVSGNVFTISGLGLVDAQTAYLVATTATVQAGGTVDGVSAFAIASIAELSSAASLSMIGFTTSRPRKRMFRAPETRTFRAAGKSSWRAS